MNASHILRGVAALALGLSLVAATAVAQSNESRSAKSSEQPAATRIDINRASATELEALPGVGPARALAIVEARTRMNGFSKVEDLMRVKGIGRKTFRDLQPLVTVGAQPKGQAPASKTPQR